MGRNGQDERQRDQCFASVLGVVPEHVRVLGFVSQSTERGKLTMGRAFSESHFLVLPTTVDCCPNAFAEANSFGLSGATSTPVFYLSA